jgi:hypothetical protein
MPGRVEGIPEQPRRKPTPANEIAANIRIDLLHTDPALGEIDEQQRLVHLARPPMLSTESAASGRGLDTAF